MKSNFKTIGLAMILVFAFVISSNAQVRNGRNSKTVTVKSTRTVSRAIPRTKVVYKTPKKKVVTYRTIPSKAVVINHNNRTYHYVNSKFYNVYNGRYIVVAPSIGLRIRSLPIGYRTIKFNNRNYFFFDGVFYQSYDKEYQVVQPEVGTIVYELPDEAEKVVLDNQEYYEFNDVLYEKIQYQGTRAYEVVAIIE